MALVDFTTEGPVGWITLNNPPANAYSYELNRELGIVNRLIESADLAGFRAAVQEYAAGFAPPHKASLAVGLIKRACQTGGEMGLEHGLALERELQQRLFQSADAQEGIAAFTEKRKPEFRDE